MKKILAIIAMSIVLGCSSSDNPDPLPTNPTNPNATGRLLRYIKSTATDLTYQSYCTYHYENNKLVKFHNGSEYTRHQFTYQLGKIWRIGGEFYDFDPQYPNILNEDFNYNIIYPGTHGSGEITYQGNSVNADYIGIYQFSDDGRPLLLQMAYENNSTYEYIYNDNNVFSKKIHTENGIQTTYRYEFDNKINPYNILYKKFGIYRYGGTMNNRILWMDESIFPHNVIKMFRNDVLVYSAIYEYDDLGYPIKKTVVDTDYHYNPPYINNKYEFAYY